MIDYQLTSVDTHEDKILQTLRGYNTQFTQQSSQPKSLYVYVYKEEKLVGAIHTRSSWDWVSIKALFYDNRDILLSIIKTVWEYYKEDVVGIKFFSPDKQRYEDFLAIGFVDRGTVEGTKKTVEQYYYADLVNDINQEIPSKYTVKTSSEEIETPTKLLLEKEATFNKEHNICDKNDDFAIVAFDEDTFVGGVTCDVYQDSIYVDLLVVKDTYRKQGVGKELMLRVEQEARRRKCIQINLGTAQFQAKGFYEKLGYYVVFTRQNNPIGYECYSLHKDL